MKPTLEHIINISGRVIDHAKQGQAGLRVEAQCNDVKLDTTTNEQGAFTLAFDKTVHPTLFKDSSSEVTFTFSVFKEGKLVRTVTQSAPRGGKRGKIKIDIVLGPPDSKATFVVKGVVSMADGAPFSRGIVRASDRDLRSEELLGESVLDPMGNYEIRYGSGQFRNNEKATADIVVKAFSADGKQQLVASPILFNAPQLASIDLTIPENVLKPISEFEKIGEAIKPLLRNVAVVDLEENEKFQDITFLSGETGINVDSIARFALAYRLTALSEIEPTFWYGLLASPFYLTAAGQGIGDQLSVVLAALPTLTSPLISRALTTALNQNLIPASGKDKIDEWVKAFSAFVAKRAVNDGGASQLKTVLQAAGVSDAQKQERFAQLFQQYQGMTPDVVEALKKDGSFKPEEIADLQTTFSIADLAQGNVSAAVALKKAFNIRQPENVRQIAKSSEGDLVKAVQASVVSGELKLPVDLSTEANPAKIEAPSSAAYGQMLAQQIRQAFPTTAFLGDLQRAIQNGSAPGLKQPEIVSSFLEAHDGFEFLTTSIDEFLKTSTQPANADLAQNGDFPLTLKAIQRVFKLAPTFEASNTLLADNLHSAQKIYRTGETAFVRNYGNRPGFTAETARRTWKQAADTHAAALTLVGDLKALEAGGQPVVLLNGNDAIASFPNWNNLFQTGDLCECEYCRSVNSPAAYFADLLMFLKDRKAKNPAQTVKDILFQRRSDLGYLELNCENANTTLPYVDIVCEVLEDVIANGENDLELPTLTSIPDDSDGTRTSVANAFSAAGVTLDGDFTLSQAGSADLWVAHSDSITYLLKKKGGPDYFAEVLPNSKASADELRANPQYVNPKAYEKLKAAIYPFALPFDLFNEEARAAFQKVTLKRWELMETLRGNAAPNNPSDGDIAAEYFNISVDGTLPIDEKRIILTADNTQQFRFWGETNDADMVAHAGRVSTFLQRTGLEYNDLLALLDLKFINPAGDIHIQHLDATCDTAQKLITPLIADAFDRIHRFLRLFKKLSGWKMWELDLVIRHPNIGAGKLDEPFLINLMNLCRVREVLGGKASVEQVCSLFGNLNTETHFTALYHQREDALYQNLFLNKRLIHPLDTAYNIDPATGELAPGQTLSGHQSVAQAALGVREADLLIFRGLTKASDGLEYINDDLSLANLSFLYRHAWLAKQLKFKAQDWATVLKLFNQDIALFANPGAALEFLKQIMWSQKSGFTPDEMDWLLSANRAARAATREDSSANFLLGLRKELQSIHNENDPSQYDFLQTSPPTDETQLTALLTTILQQLNRNEAGVNFFLSILSSNLPMQASVSGLPAGFVFPAAIATAIPISYDEISQTLQFNGVMTSAQRTTLKNDAALAAVTGIASYQTAIDNLFATSAQSNVVVQTAVTGLPVGFVMPATIAAAIPIQYNEPSQALVFTGVMTDAQQNTLKTDPSLAAVTAIAAYQTAVDDLYNQPRLAVKFYDPVFTAPLSVLPSAINFATQLQPDLTAKISYDAEQLLLQFSGVMTAAEQAALNALSPDAAYRAAVKSLADQPVAIASPDDRIWLLYADLDPTVSANDTVAKRTRSAILKALAYLSKTGSENSVVAQCSATLGLTQAMTRTILTNYMLSGSDNILQFFTGAFSTSIGAIDYASFKPAFDTWYWLNRVATTLNRWKANLDEFEILVKLTGAAQLLDFNTLPLDETGPIASLEKFLRTGRLLKLRDSFPETDITFLEVLEELSDGDYATAADFAADVELMNDAWSAADTEKIIGSLDLNYPADYLLAETWERLGSAFGFLNKLNASAATIIQFANPAITQAESNALKQLLRSVFGAETWLSLSTDIQDTLRERKRDALAAWILYQFTPAAPPSGKWEDTNDVYAYYLIDVEMGSCQLTSRLVQGSGSIQLFVQRCFMGLEPEVVVKSDGDDGDSAWKWWTWMKKYRVWEANRKVFLYPENWIEPELRRDKSQFFSDLENELLQNDITNPNAETAFKNYLEKLDGVSRLEIAGFYQEDDADRTFLHVFGRTRGGNPRLYYYRQFDYRRWTPWEKVDLDISGDYLIPAVVNKRLYLFWPIFSETPDERENRSQHTPSADSATTMPDTKKRLQLQMAVSEYKQNKWTPKMISQDVYETSFYTGEIIKDHYRFWTIDRTDIDGRFAVAFSGYSSPKFPESQFDTARAWVSGSFEMGGCKGGLELSNLFSNPRNVLVPDQVGTDPDLMEWVELQDRTDSPENDFSLRNNFAIQLNNQYDRAQLTPILIQTPDIFRVSPPWQTSWMDRLWLDIPGSLTKESIPAGSWLPFFYADKRRTFFVLPSIKTNDLRLYYPDVKKKFMELQELFEGQVQTFLDNLKPLGFPPALRQQVEQYLKQQFPDVEELPPYTDAEFLALLNRFLMRYFDYLLGYLSLSAYQFRQFHFKNDYHPFVCDFMKLINNPLKSIPALMSRDTQLKFADFSFARVYQPTPWIVNDVPIVPPKEGSYPVEDVDFTPDGTYSTYNWELFFHAPLLIANSLSKNQQFEDAMKWYNYIFNPIGVESAIPGGSAMSKYWITKPFYLTTDPQYIQQRIDTILRMLAGDTTAPGYDPQLKQELEEQVQDWRDNPFDPHRIAEYRTVAYQKTTVMKYLDNLIAWGDYLFQQDSMESINEATQLYVMAAEILGPRPKSVPPQAKPPVETFNELEDKLDSFSNALVQVENLIPPMPGNNGNGSNGGDAVPLPVLYFCIPPNDQLLTYWDTVADRLYKIRHCMNIEGVVRQLALFESPIDPGALVKAVAGGLDLSSALADLNAPLPLYRFDVLVQRANEVCADVKALGSALLTALEKRDAEALSLLRQTQEITVLQAVRESAEKQLEDANQNLDALQKSRLVVEERRNYYRDIVQTSTQEQLYLDKMSRSHILQETAEGILLGASVLSIIPAIDLGASGFGGSPVAKFKIGGLELGQAAALASDVTSTLALMAKNDAEMASVKGGYDRRSDDWSLQERLADKELDQMDSQIVEAGIRVAIAQKELDNQDLQIENSKAVDAFMRSKYTNQDLYQWQVGQISDVYFKSYKLAYDLAKRAERCFRFETGTQDSSYVNFGYWDSLKKGLLSGERLQYDLRRLEVAYLEQNRREFELTKQISLNLLDPLALITLRETGRCFFSLPEEVFDLDYPGHYFRRIKSVSLTLPCVTGPYTTISCTLRLLKNSIRINTTNGDNGYSRNTDDNNLPSDDPRFIENKIPVNAIAASTGQNDSGVFELTFRDERYLPFERAGAISNWSLELFNDLPSNNPDPAQPDFGRPLRQFDYNTITDVIVHVKYSAREDAGPFKNSAIANLRDYFNLDESTNSRRFFNLRQEFPSQWHRFLKPTNPANGNVFELEMSPDLFTFRDDGKTLKINTIWLLARCTDPGNYSVTLNPPLPPPPPPGSNTMTLARVNQYGGLHFNQRDVSAMDIEIAPANPPITWKLNMTRPGGGNIQGDPVNKTVEVEDLFLVLGYEWE